jgi:hypothetical protein
MANRTLFARTFGVRRSFIARRRSNPLRNIGAAAVVGIIVAVVVASILNARR